MPSHSEGRGGLFKDEQYRLIGSASRPSLPERIGQCGQRRHILPQALVIEPEENVSGQQDVVKNVVLESRGTRAQNHVVFAA